ncbi:MAG: ribosome biogenesis GTPase YlqF [Sedimenticola sp.]|nr:ribosome biogenesis GTPase YlqF [Sedimenticola sp.]
MHIQWYPGHMNKARKQITESLPRVDLVIEILDARIPYSSTNPMLASLRADKPCVKLLNKCDLAEVEMTRHWQAHLEQEQGVKSLAVSCLQAESLKPLQPLCRRLLPEKAASLKGIQAMIVGIPNVGKSTLINLLARRSIARTGNEPAITKRQQRINLGNGLVLLDTPGVLWPNIENPNSGYRLAVTGAIRETAIEAEEVAHFAAEYLLSHYPDRLRERYRLEPLPASASELLEAVGSRRGCLRSGGSVDMEKAGKLLLTELRAGKLGPLTLETPQMMIEEQEATRLLQEEKQARREERRARRKAKRKS